MSSLTNGTDYNWQVSATDANGNSTQAQVDYYPGYAALALPDPNPPSLPSAAVNQSYTGTIAASGGYPCYNYQVTSGNLGDYGLGWSANSCSSALIISGVPNSTGTVSFDVTVWDNAGGQATQSYTIKIGKAPPVSLPTNPNSLGSALVGSTYSGAINASGGSGGGNYLWTVNGVNVTALNGSPAALGKDADGLVATNTGGNTLNIGGSPLNIGTATLNVTVQDTSGGTSASATYTINVVGGPDGTHNNVLHGRYVCLTQGFEDANQQKSAPASRWASLSSFTMDGANTAGNGTFTGVFDVNGTYFDNPGSGSVSGTYSLGADNSGLVTSIATPTSGQGNTSKWAIAVTGSTVPAQQFRMVEVDDTGANPSGQHGTSNCYLADTTTFTSSNIGGNSFAFGMNGEDLDNNNNPKAAVGRLPAVAGTPGGTLTNGYIDIVKTGKTAAESMSFTGTYSAVDSTTSRVPFAFNANSQTINFVVYIIDSSRMFIMETTAGDGLFAGNVRKQKNTPYSNASISGPFVLYMQGFNGSNGSVEGARSDIARGTDDGAGHFTINGSYSDTEGSYDTGKLNGTVPFTIDSSNPGRFTFSPGNGMGYLYMFGNNNAFEMHLDGDGGIESGWVEPQVSMTYNDASIAGTYLMGQMSLLTSDANGNVGEFILDTNSNFNGLITTAGQGDFSFDQPMAMQYNWDPLNQFAFLVSDPEPGNSGKGGASCIVINATKFVCTLQSDSTPAVLIMQK